MAPLQTKAITSAVVGVLGELLSTAIRARRLSASLSPGVGGGGGSVHGWLREAGQLISYRRLACFGLYGLAITGPFFNWWYSYLEVLLAGIKDTIAPNLSNELGFIIRLAINQLAMTPPFLLLTVFYIQYFMTLDAERTIRTIKQTYAATLFSNWRVWTAAQTVNFLVVPLVSLAVFEAFPRTAIVTATVTATVTGRFAGLSRDR